MMYGLYNGYGGWGAGTMMGFLGGAIMMISFWILIIALIVWIARGTGGKNTNSNALDILKERYAKGEISKEQFETIKKDVM